MNITPYCSFRFPKAIIQHAIWLYLWTASRTRLSAARSGSCTRPRRPRCGLDVLLRDILPRILTAALRATLYAKAAATTGWAWAVRGPRPTC